MMGLAAWTGASPAAHLRTSYGLGCVGTRPQQAHTSRAHPSLLTASGKQLITKCLQKKRAAIASPLSFFNPSRSLLATVFLRNDSMGKVSPQPLTFGFGDRANTARRNNAFRYHAQVLHKNQVWMSQGKPFSIVFEVAAGERRSGRAQGSLLHLAYT